MRGRFGVSLVLAVEQRLGQRLAIYASTGLTTARLHRLRTTRNQAWRWESISRSVGV